jgi:hypothetical protein
MKVVFLRKILWALLISSILRLKTDIYVNFSYNNTFLLVLTNQKKTLFFCCFSPCRFGVLTNFDAPIPQPSSLILSYAQIPDKRFAGFKDGSFGGELSLMQWAGGKPPVQFFWRQQARPGLRDCQPGIKKPAFFYNVK